MVILIIQLNTGNMKLKTTYLLLLAIVPMSVYAEEEPETFMTDSVHVNGGGISAMSFVTGTSDIFDDSPEFDVAKALYGRLSGLAVNQGTGSSAYNNSYITLHAYNPTVLIDGALRSINEITASEIESVTILKDAVAAALYGVKGANGILLVKTKRGQVSPLKVTAKYQYGVHTMFRAPDFADAYTYARYLNEALRMDGLPEEYNERELEAFRTGKYPYSYPDVDWMDEVYKKAASNHRVALTFNGGSRRFRYFSAVDYMYDDALYRVRSTDDRYDLRQYDTRLSVRANVDVDVTKTTLMRAGVMARLTQYNKSNTSAIESAVYRIPAAAFPIRQEDNTYGGSAIYGANNPVALLNDKGSYKSSKATLLANLYLRQDIGPWIKGLDVDAQVTFDYIGEMIDATSKEFRYSELKSDILENGSLVKEQTWYGLDSQTLGHSSWFSNLIMRSELQGRINYSRDFDLHHFDAHAVYRQRAYTSSGRNTSYKNQEMLLTASYNFAGKYIFDFVANWSGTSYLPEGDRFNFYPAASLGWVASEEGFMKDSRIVSYFKLFASAGLSGNDRYLSHELYYQPFGYENAKSYYFAKNVVSYAGRAEGNLPILDLTPEFYMKYNAGFDLRLFGNRLSLYGEFYNERRSRILVSNNKVSGVIGIGLDSQNIGEQNYMGVDFSLSWGDRHGDFRYDIYANGGWLTSKIIEDGQGFQKYDYLYTKGNKVNQAYGLEVLGFFQSEEEIASSPRQSFSDVRPGDLKYKDQNGDNRIDYEDYVKLAGSTIPALTYGFGFELGYRNWELSADFSGKAGVTVNLLSSPLYKPISGNYTISDTYLDREIPWTPENADRATMPRLSSLDNTNNTRNSSWWYRDGSFLKLRNLMISYTFTKDMIGFSDIKVYLQGTNLFSIDGIGFADPEQLGAAYPATRAFWIGAMFSF